MQLKTYFAQDASGNIMPGATVTECMTSLVRNASRLVDISSNIQQFLETLSFTSTKSIH